MTRVTVEEALQRARMTINMPAVCIMLACLGQALVIVPSGTAPLPVLYGSGLLGILGWPLSWLYRSVQTPHWKLWAYSGAGNAREMKAAAIAAKVIAPDGSLFERTEICSPEMRAEIRRLEGRA
ncbi:hypothetical protein [Asticcacaulis solisilvae]|uniref:hypothetical protein n=1 Tax=Asticcacaulis solisilvae TaxID=1217274 RepID=UPI003FD8E876